MTYPGHWVATQADSAAIIMASSGEQVTFAELESAANQGAQLLRKMGLKRGDTFALWSGNNARFLEIVWAMRRCGVYMVPIPSKLTAEEAAYLVNDSQSQLVIIDSSLKHALDFSARLSALCPDVKHAYSLNSPLAGLDQWEAHCAAMPDELIADPSPGQSMAYSSGTTGKPKGVKQPLPEGAFDAPPAFAALMAHRYHSTPGTCFLLSAPLYHSGPLNMAMSEQSLGATVLLFEKFDAELMLKCIERYRPERGQFVPTMFIRLLKLPENVRKRYDVSSLKVAIHSAAPCPVETKHAMINWWGPILEEIYGGTENVGSTMISSEEWLQKPGSVGRASRGSIHICDEQGKVLPAGETGTIYFDTGAQFEYHGDKQKTLSTRHPQHSDWSTFGDIGRLDEDGYLYLSDRKAFMIIAGGVNIYPQEAEDVLFTHPKVADVAVFGIPDADMGEQVKAVIEPTEWSDAGEQLAAELIAYCKSRLATLKCPQTIDFQQHLPRDDAGKLAKHAIRASYWSQQ